MSTKKFLGIAVSLFVPVLFAATISPGAMQTAAIVGLVALGLLALIDLGRGGDKSAKSSRKRTTMKAGR